MMPSAHQTAQSVHIGVNQQHEIMGGRRKASSAKRALPKTMPAMMNRWVFLVLSMCVPFEHNDMPQLEELVA